MTTDPREGTELAGYRIGSVLGRGGMGVVYLAEQQFPRRKVALKLLPAELSGDAKFRERFVRESNLAASLDHPNVIPIFGAGEVDDQLYLAMRYVEGTDLKALIAEDGRLDPPVVAAIMGQVAGALDAAHAAGLIHRDVKPANILLDRWSGGPAASQVYLSDFGLTKRASSDSGVTGTGQFLGSIDYAAPEQFQGRALDGRTDQYALGCVLFECLTGAPPFVRDNEAATMYAHLTDPPPSLHDARPDLPVAVGAVVARAMAKAPEDRFGSCGELLAAFADATGSNVPKIPPSVRTNRRRWPVIGVAAATVIASVAVLAVVLRNGHPASAPPDTHSPAAVSFTQGLVRLDPSTGRVVARTAFPLFQGHGVAFVLDAVAAGPTGVWVSGGAQNRLIKVDPNTNRIELRTGPLSVDALTLLQDGTPAVLNFQEIDLIDPATGGVSDVFRASPNIGPEGNGSIAADLNAVWYIDSQEQALYRGNFDTRKFRSTLLPGQPNAVVSGSDGVWVTDNIAGELLRIDPATGMITHRISLPGSADALADGMGSVWVMDRVDGTVIRVDPATNRVLQTIAVGTAPTGISVGAGAVWVSNGDDATVSKIDPTTTKVTTFPVGGRALAVGADDQGVWVLVGLPA